VGCVVEGVGCVVEGVGCVAKGVSVKGEPRRQSPVQGGLGLRVKSSGLMIYGLWFLGLRFVDF
jgi:hypothetical protein